MKRHICTLFLWGQMLMMISAVHGGVIYVDANASDGGNGSSWALAYTHVQDALLYSSSGDEIWVADGEYYPDYGDSVFEGDRYESFTLKANVALYGGFAGTETSRLQRDPDTNVSKLSGKIGTLTDGSEDTIHVVFAEGVDGTAILDGFTIEGGSAETGSDEYSQGGGIYILDASPSITNVIFSDNQAYSGGGAYISGPSASPVFTDCTFSGNAAFWDGGAVYSSGASANFSNCTFSFNYALDGQGGGMFVTGTGSLVLADCNFSNNESVYGGGGLSTSSASPGITGSAFSSNTVTSGMGGGIEILSGNPTLFNCTINGNASSYAGGGMAIWTGNPVIQNVTFSENQDNGAYGGGGVFSYESSPTFRNVTFDGNFADYGGGIYMYGQSPILENCIFSTNTQLDSTNDGGGGAIFNYDAKPAITRCNFSWNSAKVGGAIYSYFSAVGTENPKLVQCKFEGNATLASGQGGAIANWNAQPTMINSEFTGNTAAIGGAIWNESSAVGGQMVNCLFSGNTATDSGGAVYCPQDAINCTFSHNTAATGAAIYDVSGKTFTNCILFGNTATTQGNPIEGTTLQIQYSLVEGGYTGTGNISSNPQFTNAETGDYTLLSNSPARDAGNATDLPKDTLDVDGDSDVDEALPTDLSGNARIFNASVDMGAYEFFYTDSDNDLMPDYWEEIYGFDISVDDSAEDQDGDSFTNLQEYLLGTNPTNSTDAFRADEVVALGNGTFQLTWTSVSGKEYSIQTSTNLTEWADVVGSFIATSDTTTTSVNIDPDSTKAFFRVVLVQ